MKYAWIHENRGVYPTPMMCDLLGVSRSWLFAAAKRQGSDRRMQEAEVVEAIRRAQKRHKGRYGRRRMTPEVSEEMGHSINQKRIGRLMREHGLGSRKRRPFRVRTTDSRHDQPIAPNVLARDFVATLPDQKWLADVTYVRQDVGVPVAHLAPELQKNRADPLRAPSLKGCFTQLPTLTQFGLGDTSSVHVGVLPQVLSGLHERAVCHGSQAQFARWPNCFF